MRRIVSRDNPHFKTLRKLVESGRERRKSGCILLDGLHLIAAYGQCYGMPTEVIVSEASAGRPEVAAYLAGCGGETTVTMITNALFAALAMLDSPSGIMAVVARPAASAAIDHGVDSVLLDGIQDPGNVGSLLRSSAAAGFRQVLLSVDCAQAWSPKTLRAAMGAHFLLDVHEEVDLARFIQSYRGRVVATALTGSTSLYAASLSAPLAWVFGSEGQGIRPAVAAASEWLLRIPMAGGVESLNVAAAAAICLFETVRQRRAPPWPSSAGR